MPPPVPLSRRPSEQTVASDPVLSLLLFLLVPPPDPLSRHPSEQVVASDPSRWMPEDSGLLYELTLRCPDNID